MTLVPRLVRRNAEKNIETNERTRARWAAGTTAAAFVCLMAAVPLAAQTTPPVVLPYTINTIAGTGTAGVGANGALATASEVSSDLRAVAVDTEGDVYFADTGNNLVWEINHATGDMTIVAGGYKILGNGSVCGTHVDEAGDGCPAATATKLDEPRGLALDKAGNLYIADYGYSEISVVNRLTGIMTMVAGAVSNHNDGGTKTYSGDGGMANIAGLNEPRGVRVDNQGNIWICDTGNNVIREVNAQTGIITTVVGADTNGTTAAPGAFAGDGGPADKAELYEPTDIVFDKAGNAYIADFNNNRVREVYASSGTISGASTINTIVGDGVTATTTPAPAGTQPGTSVALGNPTKIGIDTEGNLYFADSSQSVVYFYDAVTKNVSILAGQYGYTPTGTGFTVCGANTDSLGDGCPATQALFYQGTSALGVAVDAENNLYVTDPGDSRIREVSTDLMFAPEAIGTAEPQTLEMHFSKGDAQAATNGISVGGPKPSDYTISSAPSCAANSDTTTNCTFNVTFNPVAPGIRTAPLMAVSTLGVTRSFPLFAVGKGVLSAIDPGTASLVGSGLSGPRGAKMDAAGDLFIADTKNNRVVEINATTQAQTVVAGTGTAGSGGNGGAAASAQLNAPASVVVSTDGTLYIADTGNNEVRAVNLTTGVISLFAGGGGSCGSSNALYDLATDVLGDGCPATQASLSAPAGLTTDSYGNLYIADTGDNVIRVVDARTGTINLYAGLTTEYLNGTSSTATVCTTAANPDNYGDGCSLTAASFSGPTGLVMDASGNLFIADTGDNIIREASEGSGLVTKVAGNGQSVFTGDGGPATSASLSGPTAVAEDAAGDLYIADTGNAAVRLVSAGSGDISTLLGQGGSPGSDGGSGSASLLALRAPSGVALDAIGDVYVIDTGNNRAIEDNRNLGLLAFGRDNTSVVTPEQTATLTNIGNQSETFSATPFYSASGDTSDFMLDFSGPGACSGAALAASASCTLAASFDPNMQGNLMENITFPANPPSAGMATLELTGTGVQLATTTTTLVQTSPTGALSYGEPATFTATVSPTAGGSGTPTGTVTFSVDGKPQTPVVTLSGSDTATLTVNLPVGNHTISAVYSGDDTFAASNATISAPVSLAPTTTKLTISPSTQIQQQPVTLTAQVTSSTTGIPTGTVTFMSGTTALGPAATLSATGVATLTITESTVGTYPVVAVYSGDPNYAASSSMTETLVINPIPPGFTVTPTVATGNTPNAFSVVQGGTAQVQLNVLSAGGITGTVTLSCTGLPANATCGFFPTTLMLTTAVPASTPGSDALNGCTPTSNSEICTTMTIATNVTPLAVQTSAVSGNGETRVLTAAFFFPALLMGLWLLAARKRPLPGMMLAIVCLAGLGLLGGCASNATQEKVTPTPPGVYTVNAVLQGPDNITQTVPLTVTVVAYTPGTQQGQ